MKRLLAVFCSVLVLALAFPSVHASAFTDGAYLTPAAFRAVIGDTLPATVSSMVGSDVDLTSVTFTYFDSGQVVGGSADIPASWPFLAYSAYAPNLVNNPSYITVDLSPYFSILDTSVFHGFIAIGGSEQSWQTAVPPYQSPQWRVHCDGSASTFEHAATGGVVDSVQLWATGNHFLTVNADIVQNTAFDFSSIRATFSNVHGHNGMVYLVIGVPYVSQDSSVVTGTVATTTSVSTTETTAANVNVNVDMSETNSLLQELLDGFGDFLLAPLEYLFIPRQSFVMDKLDSLMEYFSWFQDLVDAWNDVQEGILDQSGDAVPSVSADFSRTAEGALMSYHGTVSVLDMSWYSDYKSIGDAIISAFLWICFLWRTFAHLPGIINGASMDTKSLLSHSPSDD